MGRELRAREGTGKQQELQQRARAKQEEKKIRSVNKRRSTREEATSYAMSQRAEKRAQMQVTHAGMMWAGRHGMPLVPDGVWCDGGRGAHAGVSSHEEDKTPTPTLYTSRMTSSLLRFRATYSSLPTTQRTRVSNNI